MTIRTGIGGWTYPDWRGGVFFPAGLRQADDTLASSAGHGGDVFPFCINGAKERAPAAAIALAAQIEVIR